MMDSSTLVMLSPNTSAQYWEGIGSKKFRYPERQHFASRDMLKTLHAAERKFLGRKHFTLKHGSSSDMRGGLRVFPTLHNKTTNLNDVTSFKKLAYIPPQKNHLPKLHGYADLLKKPVNKSMIMPPSFVSMKKSGVKTDDKFADYQHVNIEENERDKERSKSLTNVSPAKSYAVAHKLNWRDRDRMMERADEIKNVSSLANWEDTCLKQALIEVRTYEANKFRSRKQEDSRGEAKRV